MVIGTERCDIVVGVQTAFRERIHVMSFKEYASIRPSESRLFTELAVAG
jgi:hypothetical protein